MSWFKRKPKPVQPHPEWWPTWQSLREAFPIGLEFEYLGRRMIVTHHQEFDPPIHFCGTYYPGTPPTIFTEYADEHGVIHQYEFRRQRWPLLLQFKKGGRTAT